MHRKFIAFVVTTAILITGISAAPARADTEDIAKVIAGIAALAIIGAAIEDSRDDRPKVVTRNYSRWQNHPRPRPRPVPQRVQRYDLPAQCLFSYRRKAGPQRVLGHRCLSRNYPHWKSLPAACRVEFWDGYTKRLGYQPNCLRNRGYRLAHR